MLVVLTHDQAQSLHNFRQLKLRRPQGDKLPLFFGEATFSEQVLSLNCRRKAGTMLFQLLVQLRMVADIGQHHLGQSSHRSRWAAALGYHVRSVHPRALSWSRRQRSSRSHQG